MKRKLNINQCGGARRRCAGWRGGQAAWGTQGNVAHRRTGTEHSAGLMPLSHRALHRKSCATGASLAGRIAVNVRVLPAHFSLSSASGHVAQIS